jgi:prevent-host-death family protein
MARRGYNSLVKKASISEAKNAFSALLDRVRQGRTIVIEDRGVPVARLEPIAERLDPDGRLARLERQGFVRAPRRPLPKRWLESRPPRLLKGRRASDVVLEERRDGR